MKHYTDSISRLLLRTGILALALGMIAYTPTSQASGGSGGGGGGGGTTIKVDSIKVTKCFFNAPGGPMLIKASSSDTSARLFAYTPDGILLGELQNGGGSRYGGTVIGYYGPDPVNVTVVSTSGGRTIVPTTPFQI